MSDILINPYQPHVKFKNFLDLDSRLTKHYDHVFDMVIPFNITARYFFELGKVAFRDMYWYIDQLYDVAPSTVIDVGCGECTWKTWFPNIIGFDPTVFSFSQSDFVDYFDSTFSQSHVGNYDCGMALNSLHFTTWHDIDAQIALAMNIVTKRFLFTINLKCLEHAPPLENFDLVYEFRKKLNALNYNIIMFDSPLHQGFSDSDVTNTYHVNGHIRFILEHKNHG
jgi:hypothetical protein